MHFTWKLQQKSHNSSPHLTGVTNSRTTRGSCLWSDRTLWVHSQEAPTAYSTGIQLEHCNHSSAKERRVFSKHNAVIRPKPFATIDISHQHNDRPPAVLHTFRNRYENRLHCKFESQINGTCRMERKESRAGEDSSCCTGVNQKSLSCTRRRISRIDSRISSRPRLTIRIYRTTSDVTNTMCLVFKYSINTQQNWVFK